jgi:hypothetical protein
LLDSKLATKISSALKNHEFKLCKAIILCFPVFTITQITTITIAPGPTGHGEGSPVLTCADFGEKKS